MNIANFRGYCLSLVWVSAYLKNPQKVLFRFFFRGCIGRGSTRKSVYKSHYHFNLYTDVRVCVWWYLWWMSLVCRTRVPMPRIWDNFKLVATISTKKISANWFFQKNIIFQGRPKAPFDIDIIQKITFNCWILAQFFCSSLNYCLV
jgi:hypothetical protein